MINPAPIIHIGWLCSARHHGYSGKFSPARGGPWVEYWTRRGRTHWWAGRREPWAW